MYALQSMLKIREMREDRAASDLTVARRARAVSEAELEKRRKELSDYEETKEERRDRIYDAIIGRTVKMDDLDDARAAVSRIDEEGLMLEKAEQKANDDFKEKDKATDVARVRFVAATKNKMKIVEHKAAWMEEERKEQERASDAEMEEFTGKKEVADDDDALD